MTTDPLIRAAQYVRMSTEHQQYSLENQSTAIQKYAESHGFQIVRTYSDAAKTGLSLKYRTGLQQLLQDVVSGAADYRVILVYDVSRWGRFQDTDESAHYEFLCKSAGVPVHYCAEAFSNDGTLPNLIMKALKRTMAGEYSRELGAKVLAGQKRLARLGFKQGGVAGYGLRRMLISSAGILKHELAFGERKSIVTDRVILVPGPAHEVQCVRDIFRLLVSDNWKAHRIAQDLKRRRIPYTGRSEWDYQAVYNILTNPKYAGCHVFGRTSGKLHTPVVRLPESDWIVSPGAFEPIIDLATFETAQKILKGRTINKSNQELLNDLRALLASEGKLSVRLIQESPGLPAASTFHYRFGGLRQAYKLIGYGRSDHFGALELRRRVKALREELFSQMLAIFPKEVSINTRGPRWRSALRLPNGMTISVIIARSMRTRKNVLRWRIDPIREESKFTTLLARLNETNNAFLDFHVLRNINKRRRFHIRLRDRWLKRGKRLRELSRLCEVVARIGAARRKRL